MLENKSRTMLIIHLILTYGILFIFPFFQEIMYAYIPAFFLSLGLALVHLFHDEPNPSEITVTVKLTLIPWYIVVIPITYMIIPTILNFSLEGFQVGDVGVTFFLLFLIAAAMALGLLFVAYAFLSYLPTSFHIMAYTIRKLVKRQLKVSLPILLALVLCLLPALDVIGAAILHRNLSQFKD